MKNIEKYTYAFTISLTIFLVAIFHNKHNVTSKEETMNSNTTFQVTNHEVTFQNLKDNITLSATLSVPNTQSKPTAVILISGMGPNDRDNTVMGHKLFLPVSEYFSKRGIAVLRYDKRGTGTSSGVFNMTITSADLAGDVLAALEFLKNRSDIDTKKIGFVGTSEGGFIAFMAASQSPDVAFVVSMAGAVSNDVILNTEMQLRADGATDQFLADDKKIREKLFAIINTQSENDAQTNLTTLLKEYVENLTDQQKSEAKILPFAITGDNYHYMIDMFNSPWYRYYLKTDSLNFISKVKVPVLAINGGLDFCMPAKIALTKVEHGLKIANNQDFTIITIPNQNHWFQECKTGAMSEYGTIQEVMNESTLKLMADWIIEKNS